jgi:hypothetical protein
VSELILENPPAGAAPLSNARSAPPVNPNYKPPATNVITDAPGFAIERATLDEGAIVLQWPETLSAESVHELEYWLKGILNRAKRKAGIKPKADKPPVNDESA